MQEHKGPLTSSIAPIIANNVPNFKVQVALSLVRMARTKLKWTRAKGCVKNENDGSYTDHRALTEVHINSLEFAGVQFVSVRATLTNP